MIESEQSLKKTNLGSMFETVQEPHGVESPKWVRAFFGGRRVADSKRVLLVREKPLVYFFPREDVAMELLEPATRESGSESEGRIQCWNLTLGGHRVERAAWSYPESRELRGYIAFKWEAIDNWFEEDEEIFVHPHDPYHRIDVHQSSRYIRVHHRGQLLAESRRPVLLFETGLPTRFYLPKIDINLGLFKKSDKITHCPYKGEAHYYSLRIGEPECDSIGWYYRYPKPIVESIRNMICFYHERLDQVIVDGEDLKK